MQLKNLSLIILTFNRPHYLLRLLKFISKSTFNAQVIIADASFSDIKKLNRSAVGDFGEYLSISPDMDMYQTMVEALSLVNRPYVQFVADDDFPILKTSQKLCEILDQDVLASCAIGKFEYLSTGTWFNQEIPLGLNSILMVSNSYLQDSAIDRLLFHKRSGEGKVKDSLLPSYSVMRSDLAKHIYSNLLEYKGATHKWVEISAGTALLILGKIYLHSSVGVYRTMHGKNGALVSGTKHIKDDSGDQSKIRPDFLDNSIRHALDVISNHAVPLLEANSSKLSNLYTQAYVGIYLSRFRLSEISQAREKIGNTEIFIIKIIRIVRRKIYNFFLIRIPYFFILIRLLISPRNADLRHIFYLVLNTK